MSPSHILITVPDLERPGGVSSLFNILKLDKNPSIEYFELHSKLHRNRVLDLFSIFWKFSSKIQYTKLVHINPSFDKKSIFRDGLLVLIALKKKKKVLVYWHGWQNDYESIVKNNRILNYFFKQTFGKANFHVVLGDKFKNKLISFGVKSEKIVLESNAADNSYILADSLPKIKNDQINLLFIARVEKEKGIYIAIDSTLKLSEKYPVVLNIAGHGTEFDKVKDYVRSKNSSSIKIWGQVSGVEKHNLFKTSNFLLFPTFHPEGMPISIIEGMLYGLPIISTPVGGIPDWVIEGENGFLLDSVDFQEFAEKVSYLIENEPIQQKISDNNHQKANSFFTPKTVEKRLNKYYKELIANI